MTNEEARDLLARIEIKEPNEVIVNSWWGSFVKDYKDALQTAIKSLEAWGKVEKEIDDSILICQEYAQDDTWCDGELAGFLQSKDIINRNLAEVSE